MSQTRILLADDQADVIQALRLLLKPEGYEIETASNGFEIVDRVKSRDFDVVLMDMNYLRGDTSGQQGLDVLSQLRQLDDLLPVVVMTAWANIELAVEAMRRGARDFVPKPWKNERLLAVLRTQVELGGALRRGKRLEQENTLLKDQPSQNLIASSPVMQPVLEAIQRVGPSDANVLITGDNGTGKGVVAQALHAASLRSDQPLITINTAGIPESVFESELFGHVAGAFTDAKTNRMGRFQLADRGTLFLDEIATVPMPLQSKLLRVLESGEFEPIGSSKTIRVNVRILSATNADLTREIAEGRFRQDLFYRLNTVPIHLPPLKERREDIPALAHHFMQRYITKYRKSITGLAPAALALLQNYPWPGNVRELDHALERAVLMATGDLVDCRDLGLVPAAPSGLDVDHMTLDEIEQWVIRRTLDRSGGDISKAAIALGLSRGALYRRLEKYGIE